MRLIWAIVTAADPSSDGSQCVRVRLDGGSCDEAAVAYTSLAPTLEAGDRVLCNTTAVDLGLGTGGEHFVVARAGEGTSFDDPVSGHIMKLRYTPLQRDVTVIEEPASGHHEVMAAARTLDGMPVVCCGLHSQVPVVAAAIKQARGDLRTVYVMTDAASLPMAVSRIVPKMRRSGLLDGTVSTGQAFGGEMETVNLYSGLLAARHVGRADVAIVAIGPGIPGTGTPFGHSGVAQGQALNAAASLGGLGIAVLRLSFADPRPRHVPVSHQTLTALESVALAPALVPVPVLDEPMRSQVAAALEASSIWDRHERVEMDVAGMPDTRGLTVRSMGRAFDEDPAFFLAAAAAGQLAADRAVLR